MPEHTPAPTPSRAVYGFALFLSMRLLFFIYIVWVLVPEAYFHSIGITFLPQRYWAVAIPIFLLTVLTIFAFFIYPSLGLIMTPDIDDLRTVKDSIGSKRKTNGEKLKLNENTIKSCVCRDPKKCHKNDSNCINLSKRIPALIDLDIGQVSEHLYLK